MLNAEIRANADYQKFVIRNGRVGEIDGRMLYKLDALEPILPEWDKKTVLDIGCDFGFWSFLAAEYGAQVLGLDRSRSVKNIGHVDIPKLNNETATDNGLKARFLDYELGYQWHDLGQFDVVLMMSLYHHVFQNTGGDHESIWYWLWRHTNKTLIWENPLDANDSVVRLNVNQVIHPLYNEQTIRTVAEKYFDIVYEGPALHEPTRVVWKLEPKDQAVTTLSGIAVKGAGGASKAFVYQDDRRIKEIEFVLGIKPLPGSLNVILDSDFSWDSGYYRTAILDVKDRSKGLNSEWGHRPVRFYPVKVNGKRAFAMRFEGEKYPLNMVELISGEKLNTQKHVEIEKWQ